jgi:hypothetical protein
LLQERGEGTEGRGCGMEKKKNFLKGDFYNG